MVTTAGFGVGDQRITADFVEDVLVRYTDRRNSALVAGRLAPVQVEIIQPPGRRRRTPVKIRRESLSFPPALVASPLRRRAWINL